MVEDDLVLLLNYPLISSEIHDGIKHYRGIITSAHKDYELHVVEEINDGQVCFKSKTSFGCELDESVAKIESTNIVDFLDKVVAILKTHSERNEFKNRVIIYRKILHEYCEFVKFYFKVEKSELSVDLSTIHATAVDEGGRKHSLEIRVDFGEIKHIYRLHDLDLPEQFCKDLLNKFSNLTEAFGKFWAVVDMLQPFFDVMDVLDKNCCILDPEKPRRRDCYRRIWLDQNLSMLITVDPSNVRIRPDIKFLGPERLVLQYRDKLNEKLDEWDTETNILQGLLNILEMKKFPSKPESNQDEVLMETGECSICFSLRFNNKLPEVVCSNKSCENFYHVDCLFEWLASVNSKRIFNEIRGQCPNCEKGISCPLPELAATAGGGVM